MRAPRLLALLFLVAVAAGVAFWWWSNARSGVRADAITVFYAKPDGATLATWRVTLGPARDRRSVAFYAAVQCVAGPPAGTPAVRFPPGTRVRSLSVDGTTADVDLSSEVRAAAGGSYTEGAIFKALTYTLTEPMLGIDSVRVRIDGASVAALPGGHLELDAPFTRSSF